jgi:hypothetical protein
MMWVRPSWCLPNCHLVIITFNVDASCMNCLDTLSDRSLRITRVCRNHTRH